MCADQLTMRGESVATDSNIRYGCSPVCRIFADQLTIWSPALLLSLTYPLQRSVLLCVHICTHLYTMHICTLCTLKTLCSCVSDHRAEHDKGGGHHWDLKISKSIWRRSATNHIVASNYMTHHTVYIELRPL